MTTAFKCAAVSPSPPENLFTCDVLNNNMERLNVGTSQPDDELSNKNKENRLWKHSKPVVLGWKKQHLQIWMTNCRVWYQVKIETEWTRLCVMLRSGDQVFGVGSSPCGRANNVTLGNSSGLWSWWASGRWDKTPKSSTWFTWTCSLPAETPTKRSGRTRTPCWTLTSVMVSWSTRRPPAWMWHQVCSEPELEAERIESVTLSVICSSNGIYVGSITAGCDLSLRNLTAGQFFFWSSRIILSWFLKSQ